MLVFFVLGNAKVLSFALGDTKIPNANGFVSQWNIGLRTSIKNNDHIDLVLLRINVTYRFSFSI